MGIELGVVHVERIVMALEGIRIGEVESERRVDTHGRKMSHRPRISDPEDIGKNFADACLPCAGTLVV
jgi:hypothetical protein